VAILQPTRARIRVQPISFSKSRLRPATAGRFFRYAFREAGVDGGGVEKGREGIPFLWTQWREHISPTLGTIAAACATVTVSRRGRLNIEKLVVVLDAGHVINPHTAAEQCEGSVCWELSHAWTGVLELESGRFTNNNFDTYNLLRDQMPHVETYFASSGGTKWSWRTGRPADSAGRRQRDLFCDRQADPLNPVPQPRPELGLIAHQSGMTFPRIAIPFEPCRPSWRKRH
jgi:Molybdopterin-binding domain of aldehyde dehydrogenase